MIKENLFRFSRGSLLAITAMLVWMGLPLGIYRIATGSTGWGVFLTAASLLILAAAIDARLLRQVEARSLPRARGGFMLGGWIIVAIMMVSFALLSASALPERGVFMVVYVAGILVLLSVTIWQVTLNMRNHSRV